MGKEIISQKQGISLVVFMMYGSTALLKSIIKYGKSAWISLIIAFFFAILFQFIYSKILKLYPEKNLYQILEIIFGKFIGKTIQVLYVLFFFSLSGLVLREFSEFLTAVSITNTPQLVPMIFIIILSIWTLKEGVEVLGRLSQLFVLVPIGALGISTLLLIPNMDINNIRPILSIDYGNLFEGAFHIFLFPFGEMIIFTVIFSSLKFEEMSPKIFIMGLTGAFSLLLVSTLIDLLVLSPQIAEKIFFPTYNAVSKINIGEFIQRLEIIDGVLFVLGGFVKLTLCVLATSKGVSNFFSLKDYRPILTPLCILIIIFAYTSFESTYDMFKWLFNIFPYFSIPFQVILPIIILIRVLMLNRKKRLSKT